MNKSQAFEATQEIYPQLKPSRAAGFTTTPDGKGLIISGMDQNVAIVLYHPTDLSRLETMLQLVKNKQGKTS